MNIFNIDRSPSGWEKMNRNAADDVRLTAAERGILTWILTRPTDHYFTVWYLCERMGISKPTWEKTSRKLQKLGYLKYKKTRGANEFDHIYEFTDTPDAPNTEPAQQDDGFEAALRLVADSIEEFKFQANSKRRNSITKFHWKNHCIPQLKLIYKNDGVDGMREVLNEAAAHRLLDFSAILDGSIKVPL